MLTPSSQEQISLNTRFLLWRQGVAPADWPAWLCRRAGYAWSRPDRESAPRRVLTGGELADDEVEELAAAFAIPPEELRLNDLLLESGTDILFENIRHLVGGMERGGKKRLAIDIGVDPTTVSRWLAGTSRPPNPTLRQLASYFGLPTHTDLASWPSFLSPDPVSITERKEWLMDRINSLEADDLGKLYPALQKLLEES